MINDAAPRLRISLLGAPGTGKTQLAADLLAALPVGNQPWFAIDDNPPLPLTSPHPASPALLMGLDLPAQQGSSLEREAADRALRNALAQSGVNYQVVYGQGAERLHNALRALQAWLPASGVAAQGQRNRADRWVWACDNCSDPQCERRLLSDLLAARATAR